MKLIISDFFGVLIDEDGPSFFRQYLHENSHEVADQYFCHGDSGEMTMDEVIHLIAEHYKVDEEFLHNYMYTHPSFHRGYFDKLKEMKKEGYHLSNVVVDILLQEPKLKPYREKIKESLAELLSLDISRIGLSANTGEHVGVIGKKEAIIVYATVLLIKD